MLPGKKRWRRKEGRASSPQRNKVSKADRGGELQRGRKRQKQSKGANWPHEMHNVLYYTTVFIIILILDTNLLLYFISLISCFAPKVSLFSC